MVGIHRSLLVTGADFSQDLCRSVRTIKRPNVLTSLPCPARLPRRLHQALQCRHIHLATKLKLVLRKTLHGLRILPSLLRRTKLSALAWSRVSTVPPVRTLMTMLSKRTSTTSAILTMAIFAVASWPMEALECMGPTRCVMHKSVYLGLSMPFTWIRPRTTPRTRIHVISRALRRSKRLKFPEHARQSSARLETRALVPSQLRHLRQVPVQEGLQRLPARAPQVQ